MIINNFSSCLYANLPAESQSYVPTFFHTGPSIFDNIKNQDDFINIYLNHQKYKIS